MWKPPEKMTLAELRATVMPFGKYKGQTFADMENDGDYSYLDYLLTIAKQPLKGKLVAFLNNPSIAPKYNNSLEQAHEEMEEIPNGD